MANYSFVVGDYRYTSLSSTDLKVQVQANDKTKTSYADVPSSVSYGGKTFTIEYIGSVIMNGEDMPGCFEGCTNLITAPVVPAGTAGNWYAAFEGCSSLVSPPAIPSGVTSMSECFTGCTSLIQAPVIPSGVTHIPFCFADCTSLTQAPDIPSSVTNIVGCFQGCTSLTGNINVHNSPTYYSSIFTRTSENIFIINNGSGTVWKTIAEQYQNVHYEADDNPAPVISNFSATRVSAVGSTDFDATGLYAYIQARVMVYNIIPVGWNNTLETAVLTDNGSVESPTWQPLPITQYPADEYCWIYLGDTSTHTITLQITDAVREDGSTAIIKTQTSQLLSVVISKTYALVDYYHDETTDTEGIAFGKYAEHADLFDVDMPTRFRQGVNSDGNVQGENLLLALDTTATSGTDKEIYDALVSLGWDSDVIV